MKKFTESNIFTILIIAVVVGIDFGLVKIWDNLTGDSLFYLGTIIILYSVFVIWFIFKFVTYRLMKEKEREKDTKNK